MNVCKWRMRGAATENSILLSVLLRLNKIFNQSINNHIFSYKTSLLYTPDKKNCHMVIPFHHYSLKNVAVMS